MTTRDKHYGELGGLVRVAIVISVQSDGWWDAHLMLGIDGAAGVATPVAHGEKRQITQRQVNDIKHQVVATIDAAVSHALDYDPF